jgi:regulator of replication initiation timing
MRKLFRILSITAIILAITGFITVIAFEMIENPLGNASAMEWYETYIEPRIVTTSIALGVTSPIYLVLQKIIEWLKKAITGLDTASNRVNSTVEENTALKVEMSNLKAGITELKEIMTVQNEDIKAIKKANQIAYSNSAELVKNGYSRKISEVLNEKTD